jgi:hypothetical protein
MVCVFGLPPTSLALRGRSPLLDSPPWEISFGGFAPRPLFWGDFVFGWLASRLAPRGRSPLSDSPPYTSSYGGCAPMPPVWVGFLPSVTLWEVGYGV